EAHLLRLDYEEQSLAILGTLREIAALFAIYQSFGRTFTREELEAAEADYWQKRLVRQANQSLLAGGGPGLGNVEALDQMGANCGLPAPRDFLSAAEVSHVSASEVSRE